MKRPEHSKKMMGKNNPMWGKKRVFTKETLDQMHKSHTGKKFTGEHKRKIGLALRGKSKSEEHRKKLRGNKGNFGKKFSEEHKLKIKNALIGKSKTLAHRIQQSLSKTNRNEFAGFVSPLQLLIRTNQKYKLWRFDVFKRDDFTCKYCGIRSKNIEVHHIKEFHKIIKDYNIKTLDDALKCKELWSINNGITFCCKCHAQNDIFRNNFMNSNITENPSNREIIYIPTEAGIPILEAGKR